MLSIKLAEGYAAGKQLVAGLRLAANAVSLGGVETLAIHAASVWEGSLRPAQINAAAGPVRIAVGLEDVEDLKRDFAAACGDIC